MPRGRRERLADAACVAGCLLLAALVLRYGDAGWPRPGAKAALDWPADATIGAIGCLLLWYRRRHPLAVALALLPAGAVAGSVGPAIAVAVFTLAVAAPARPAIAMAAAQVATVVVYFALQADPRHPLAMDLVIRGGLVAGALGWGRYVGVRARLVAELLDRARGTERARIAREMHDVLGHRLSLVSLHAGALEVSAAEAAPAEVAEAAAVIRGAAHAALEDLRTVIGVLREDAGPAADRPLSGRADGPADQPPPGLADVPAERPLPGLADVPALVAEAGPAVDYACAVDATAAGDAAGRTVYRVVQEGLTNARKHAPGAPVTVRVEGSPAAGLRVRVVNPLTGLSTSDVPGAGLGLVGLAERVELAGGRLEHGRTERDFHLQAWLPW